MTESPESFPAAFLADPPGRRIHQDAEEWVVTRIADEEEIGRYASEPEALEAAWADFGT